MDQIRVKDVVFRREGLSPESLAYLEFKSKRLRESQHRHPYRRFLRALLPSDYWRVPVESMVRGRILVVGCAGGIETLGLGAVGIEIDLPALRIAADLRRHAEGTTASFLAASGGDLPFRDETFDSVLSDNVIEHLPPSLVPRHLRETPRVLRAGGRYVFTTPNEIFERPAKPTHVSLHSYAEWEELARSAGFRELRTHRRRSGPLEGLEWKKKRERTAIPLGLSHQGVRLVMIVATR